MQDEFGLERFVDAQERIYDTVVAELAAGRKRSHWMWFIFPQMRGLGISPAAHKYGISGPDEARAYLAHPQLGARLRECTELMLQVEGRSLNQILGSPDDLKFRSSMTLFSVVADDTDTIFQEALVEYCGGEADPRTLGLLR
jgi:uncharacterized protein (DUF1810 family)